MTSLKSLPTWLGVSRSKCVSHSLLCDRYSDSPATTQKLRLHAQFCTPICNEQLCDFYPSHCKNGSEDPSSSCISTLCWFLSATIYLLYINAKQPCTLTTQKIVMECCKSTQGLPLWISPRHSTLMKIAHSWKCQGYVGLVVTQWVASRVQFCIALETLNVWRCWCDGSLSSLICSQLSNSITRSRWRQACTETNWTIHFLVATPPQTFLCWFAIHVSATCGWGHNIFVPLECVELVIYNSLSPFEAASVFGSRSFSSF